MTMLRALAIACLIALTTPVATAQETVQWNGSRFALPGDLCGRLESDGAYRLRRCGGGVHPEFYLFRDRDTPQSRAIRRGRLNEMATRARNGGMDDMWRGFARSYGACTISSREASLESGRVADHLTIRITGICRSFGSMTEVKSNTMVTYLVTPANKQIMISADFGNARDTTAGVTFYRTLVQNVVSGGAVAPSQSKAKASP